MSEKPDTNNDMQKLFHQACQHIEHLVDKRIAADKENQRLDSHLRARNLLLTMMSLVVSLAVGAGAIIANGYAENRDRDNQVLRDANERKLAIIAGISGAMTGMRELHDLALVSCGQQTSTQEKLEFRKERIRRGYELVKISRPKLHFFSQKFRALVVSFLEWEESISDYCQPSAPQENEWLNRQKEIEDEMVLAPIEIFAQSRPL